MLVQISWECTPPYLFTGISNLLQPAQAEVLLGQRSTYLASWVKTVLILIEYIQLYIQAGGVDKTTVHFQRVEECTEGTYSPCCNRFSRGVRSLYDVLE
jgi:hypothetical protein